MKEQSLYENILSDVFFGSLLFQFGRPSGDHGTATSYSLSNGSVPDFVPDQESARRLDGPKSFRTVNR